MSDLWLLYLNLQKQRSKLLVRELKYWTRNQDENLIIVGGDLTCNKVELDELLQEVGNRLIYIYSPEKFGKALPYLRELFPEYYPKYQKKIQTTNP